MNIIFNLFLSIRNGTSNIKKFVSAKNFFLIFEKFRNSLSQEIIYEEEPEYEFEEIFETNRENFRPIYTDESLLTEENELM